MYPEKTTDLQYKSGNSFLKHSNYYDKYSEKYNISVKNFNDSIQIFGGMRKRILILKIILVKLVFFKYTFYNNLNLDVGYHLLKCRFCGKFYNKNKPDKHYLPEKIKICPDINILLHFKFIKPNLVDYFKKRIENNQDWNDCIEYKSYLHNFKNILYDSDYSIKYTDKNTLYKNMSSYFSLFF